MVFSRRLMTKGAVATLLMSLGTITAGSGVALAVAGAAPTHGITTIAGDGTAGYNGDNKLAVNAELDFPLVSAAPSGVAEDLTGGVYIADGANNRVRKVVHPTTNGQDTITTFAGNGMAAFGGDSGPATAAELNDPSAVDFDTSGNLYIADTANNRVREVLTTGVIKTFAGNGQCGSGVPLGNAGMATSASLCRPTGVAADGAGHVFISDTGHNEVRMVNPAGQINSYAGTGRCGFSGDGRKGTMANVCSPEGLALDANRDLFIADTGNSRVREVTENGNILTLAGNGKFAYSGDGGSATKAALNGPTGVGLDQSGNVFISDTLNNRIRQVSGGKITTYAGNGTKGFSGDNTADATQAALDSPSGSTAIDGTALYFADTGNQRVRAVFNGPAPVLPETNLLILLPIGTGLLLALGTGIVVFRRRRRITPTPAV
jgi:sugar lactone lactonase YvrE